MPGRSGIPTATGSATNAAPTGLYWTEPRVIAGDDPVPLGANNSGRGVGGGTVHFAGYTPRFHPSDFCTESIDGVGEDWPITYEELQAVLRGHRSASSRWPGRRGRGATRTATRTRRIP